MHWQAGESALWVDPAEIPSYDDIAKLSQALAAGNHGERDELMANTAAYTGLRWGELAALTPRPPLPHADGKSMAVLQLQPHRLKPAYLAVGWRDAYGKGRWTWHSLRHVLGTTALFTWKLQPIDVSIMAGHVSVRTTLLMYVSTTVGVRTAPAPPPNDPLRDVPTRHLLMPRSGRP